MGVGDAVAVGSWVACSVTLAGAVVLDGMVGLGNGVDVSVGVVVGCWTGVAVGVSVAMDKGMLVARIVGRGVGVGGSPYTSRAAAGMFCTTHTAASPATIRPVANSRLAAIIQRLRVTMSFSFLGQEPTFGWLCSQRDVRPGPGRQSRHYTTPGAGGQYTVRKWQTVLTGPNLLYELPSDGL